MEKLHSAFIALGSNLEDRENNLKLAIERVRFAGIIPVKISAFMETEPYGVTDQPSFINAVMKVETDKSPIELLRTLLEIELDMGRIRKRHWGERNIDLDLLFYEDVIMTSEELVLPHPDMHNRDFVLLPMAEIAPDYMHPILHKSMEQLKKELLKVLEANI